MICLALREKGYIVERSAFTIGTVGLILSALRFPVEYLLADFCLSS